MSDADRLKVSHVEEVTFGVFPSANLQNDRFTSESFGQDTNVVESAEIRNDRQIADVPRTSISASGDLNFELSYGSFDDFFEAGLLSSDWSTVQDNDNTTISFAASGGGTQVISDSASGFGSFVVNQWVRISGASNAVNNGIFKITAAAAGSITVKNPSGVVEAAGASVATRMGPQIVNGTELRTFSFEKEYTDLTTTFEQVRGLAVNTIALTVNADQLITGTFGFLGKDSKTKAATGGSGETAANGNEIFNATDDVTKLLVNDVVFDHTQLTFNLNNNLRQRLQVATLGPISLGTGNVGVTGTVQAYFTSQTEFDDYLNYTARSIAYVVEDGAGNGYVIEFPKIQFTSGRRVAGGQNSDIIADLAFSAFRDPTEGITIRIARFAA